MQCLPPTIPDRMKCTRNEHADKEKERTLKLKLKTAAPPSHSTPGWVPVAALAIAIHLATAVAFAQSSAPPPAQPPAAPTPATSAPSSQVPSFLAPPGATPPAPAAPVDPLPKADPKFFTASSPTTATVNAFLKQIWGFDADRIWRVMAIQTTAAPGVVKVVVFVTEKSPNAKVQSTTFFITPDGQHAIGDSAGVVPFGPTPFAAVKEMLKTRANGAARGPAGKDLLLVEFADLQCPHCKDAQPTMEKLAKDFPKARIVFQNFPLTEIHPFAFQAAAYGACIAKQSSDAFFTYAQAVYDTQGALLPDSAEQTLKNATTKAGADPTAIAFCANSDAAKAEVNQSTALANELGIDSTPMLSINGRLIGLASLPYETLKSLIQFQAELDGVSGAAVSPAGSGVDLKSH